MSPSGSPAALLEKVHTTAMCCLGSVIRLRQLTDIHRQLPPSEQRLAPVETVQREWFHPLYTALTTLPEAREALFHTLTTARAALGLGVVRYKELQTPNAHHQHEMVGTPT